MEAELLAVVGRRVSASTAPVAISKWKLPKAPIAGRVAVPTMTSGLGATVLAPLVRVTVSPTCLWSWASVVAPSTISCAVCTP